MPLAPALLHYGNLNKGRPTYPYPFLLAEPIIFPFPVCADTFRRADNFLPRYSLGNQVVCPNLLSLKFPTAFKCQRMITVMQLLLAQPQFTQSCTSTSQIWKAFSNPFCTQNIRASSNGLKSWPPDAVRIKKKPRFLWETCEPQVYVGPEPHVSSDLWKLRKSTSNKVCLFEWLHLKFVYFSHSFILGLLDCKCLHISIENNKEVKRAPWQHLSTQGKGWEEYSRFLNPYGFMTLWQPYLFLHTASLTLQSFFF